MHPFRSFAPMALAPVLLWGCAYDKEAIHPTNILTRSAGHSIVLLSTSSASESLSFAKALVILKIGSDGKRTPAITYAINSEFEQADIPQDHTNLRWVALEPGDYVIQLGIMNPYMCFRTSPEFFFTLGAAQRVYLGDFHPGAASIAISNQMERDVAYFRAHATGAEQANFEPLQLEMKSADNGCKDQGAPPIQVFMHR